MREPDRSRMLAVLLIGERVLMRLESIGMCSLEDLRGRDPWGLLHEVNLRAGRVILRPPLAVPALQNLVDVAGDPTEADAARGRGDRSG